jgi:hypothetical protein
MRSVVIAVAPDQKLTTGTSGTSASTAGAAGVGVGATLGMGVDWGAEARGPGVAEAGETWCPLGAGRPLARAAAGGDDDGDEWPNMARPLPKPTIKPAEAIRTPATATERALFPDQ